MNLWLIITGFNFTTAQVVCISAMINHKFMSVKVLGKKKHAW